MIKLLCVLIFYFLILFFWPGGKCISPLYCYPYHLCICFHLLNWQSTFFLCTFNYSSSNKSVLSLTNMLKFPFKAKQMKPLPNYIPLLFKSRLLSSLPCKISLRRRLSGGQEANHGQPRNWSRQALWSWTSQPPELWEINVLFKPPRLWCFAIAAEADQDAPSPRILCY